MRLPTISQYIDSLLNPSGLFRSLGDFRVDTDARGNVRMMAGNNAVIFRVLFGEKPAMLKCYIRPGRFIEKVYGYAAELNEDFLCRTRLLPAEMLVFDHAGQGAWYDVVFSEWVEGSTLEREIARTATFGNTERLGRLASAFDAMACRLLDCEWAHGDVKPDNILVTPDDALVLIDYDAMFVPGLAGERAAEIGTHPYQHPLRDGNMFDRHIDDYSLAIISVSLHWLAEHPESFARWNNTENIILNPGEILAGRSPLYAEICDRWASEGRHALHRLVRALSSHTPRIGRLAQILADVRGAGAAEDMAPDDLESFCDGGLWGFRDARGRVAVEPKYDEVLEFSEGLAGVSLGGKWSFIDAAGRVVVPCNAWERIKSFSEGLAAVYARGVWGFIDRSGAIVVEPCYEVANSLREGAAAVKSGGRYGYIDRCGAWMIPPRYDYAESFREGVACVQKDKNVVKIDKTGKELAAI